MSSLHTAQWWCPLLQVLYKLNRMEQDRTFRLEARLMIDRWRSLFFWGGVNSGSEAALSERQKGENVIKTFWPDLLNSQSNAELDRLGGEPFQSLTEQNRPSQSFFFQVFLLTFVVWVGSISKEIEELIDGSMRTCLQLVHAKREGEKEKDKKVWRKWDRWRILSRDSTSKHLIIRDSQTVQDTIPDLHPSWSKHAASHILTPCSKLHDVLWPCLQTAKNPVVTLDSKVSKRYFNKWLQRSYLL